MSNDLKNLYKIASIVDDAVPYAAQALLFRISLKIASFIVFAILVLTDNREFWRIVIGEWIWLWVLFLIPVGIVSLITHHVYPVRDNAIIATIIVFCRHFI